MIKYFIIIITTNCNLNCIYCYMEGQKKLVIKKNIIDRGLSLLTKNRPPLHIQITGGEPTLYPELIEYICESIKKYIPFATIGIQTNGTLLDSSIIKILKKYRVQLGISLDGHQHIHDITRGRFIQTIRGIELLKQYGIKCRITTTLTSINVNSLNKLAMLIGMFDNIDGIGLDMMVRKGSAREKDYLLPSKENVSRGILDFMNSINWIKMNREFHFREQETLIRHKKHKGNIFCHAQKGESMALFPDGNLYPCAQTAGDSNFLFGDLNNFRISNFNFNNKDRSCRRCKIYNLCPGDCPSRNYYNGTRYKELVCSIYFSILKSQGVYDELF